MPVSGVDPHNSTKLIAAYQASAQAVLECKLQLVGLESQAQKYLSATPARLAARRLGQLHEGLRADGQDLHRRRELFLLADSALLSDSSPQADSSSLARTRYLALAIWDTPLSATRSPHQLLGQLSWHEDLDNAQLIQALQGLVVWSLESPARASQLLKQLGADDFAALAQRITQELEAGLYVPERQTQALAMAQGLALLVAHASKSAGGLPPVIRDYLLPPAAGYFERDQIRHLGIMLALGQFHVGFASQAGAYLVDRANREVVSAALSNHPLEHPGRVGSGRGRGHPYAAMLNPLQQAHRQASGSPDSALAMLDSILESWGSGDVDTEMYHGLSPDVAVAGLLDTVVEGAAADGEFRDRGWQRLLALFEWVPEHDSAWSANSPVWSSLAQMVGLYWPQLRSVAAEVTWPTLVRVVRNPEAMSLLSLGVGSFAMGHLGQAIEVEVNPELDDTIRDRRISVHVDAVADAYHHVFAATARVSPSQEKKAMSLLASALNFVDRKLMKVLLVGSITPAQRAITTVAAMGVRKLRDHATAEIRQQAIRRDISPRSIFSSQLGNRDRAAVGGTAPEPTWFELELANKLLEHQPHLAEELTLDPRAGRWLRDGVLHTGTGGADGGVGAGAVTNSAGDPIASGVDPAFADWFANVVNANPPTEFSELFVHLRREFLNDLLLDATSVAMEGTWEKAQEALDVSRQTQKEFQDLSRELREQLDR